MAIRPKTLRRLLILFSCLGVLAVVGLVTGLMYRHNQRAMVEDLRRQGFAAYDAQDYSKAVAVLSDYFNRSHSQTWDDEAMFRYGRSRSIVPLAGMGSRHIFEGIEALERYLNLRPDDPRDAQHLLLKLYAQVQYNKEARTLAAKLLSKNPNDLEALRAEAQAMNNDRDYAAALPVMEKVNALDPLDFTWQYREQLTLQALKRPADQVVAHAQGLLKQHPNDPRFELLLALAYRDANDDASARKWLASAADQPPAGTDATIALVQWLDLYQMFDKSQQVLQAATAKGHEPQLQRLVVERSWQQGGAADVIDRTNGVDPKDPKSDSAILGYRALSLYEKNRGAEAAPIVATLASRGDDGPALAWAAALTARYGAHPAKSQALPAEYRKALDRDQTNGTIWFMLGEAYAGIGETEQAIRAWQQSTAASPAWALPSCLISRTLLKTGRFPEAFKAADYARRRAPNARITVTTYALAWYGMINQAGDAPDSEEAKNLFTLLSEIQKTWPNEPDTLPIYVTLLARRGEKDKAVDAVKQALAVEPPLPGETLTRLALVSDTENLGLNEQIIDRAQKTQGLTPEVAIARSIDLYQNGKPQEAVQAMRAAREGHPGDLQWEMVDARFHDAIGDTSALKQWTDLADKNPDNLQVQYQVLDSPSRRLDRAFWRRTIDRVKNLTGADGQIWKIEDARWHLAGEPTPQELVAVIDSLRSVAQNSPSLPEPRRLLADALVRNNDLAKAAEELQAVNLLRPGDFDTTAQLVRVLVAQGKQDQAVKVLEDMSHQPSLSPARRQFIAARLGDLGFTDRAIDLLTTDPDPNPGPARDALLAGLYRRAGRTDDAASLYRKILAAPVADANALENGAEFFASQKQPDLSRQFLDRLSKMPARPGVMEIVRGHFEETHGTLEQALKFYRDATRVAPQSQQAWQELAGFHLRHGRFSDADAAAAEGMKAINPAPGLQAMRGDIARLQSLRNSPELAPLVEVLSHDPTNPPANEMLEALLTGQAKHQTRSELAAALRQLADRYLDFLPLQQEVVVQYVTLRRFGEAQSIASRASELFPTSPEPARLLSIVYAESGKWDAARQAALRWREKAGDHPLAADVMIARTCLQQPNSDPELAIKQLAPYFEKASSTPDPAAASVYGQALIMAGRADDAAKMLRPLAQKDSLWRLVWLDLASAHKDLAAASDWIKQVVPLAPRELTADQLAIADAWRRVAEHFDAPVAFQQARDALAPLRAREPGAAKAWQLWAVVSQEMNDLPEAENGYRQALQRAPQPETENNLAYVLLAEGGADKLAEAEKLATDAIAAAPNQSTFYDTLARIYTQTGRREDAIKSFRDALNKDPNNVEAMIGLADVLRSTASGRNEAKQLFGQASSLIQSGVPLPPPLRQQFERVKTAVSSSL